MSVPLWFHNLAAYWGQIALLAIVGTLLPALLRLRIPRVLLVYWQVLVGASLLLPALQPWKRLVTDSPTPLPAGLVWIEGAARAGHVTTGHFPFYSGVAVVLVTGIGVRLLWTAFGLLRLRRYRRKASPLPALPAAVEEIQSRFGIRPALCLSDEVSAPVTFGLMHPVILFPRRFPAMAPSYQRAIACHELLHVRRNDWAFVLIEEVIRACFWFHPAIWWLLGRIQLSREQVVDRQVVELTEARTPYLEALLAMAANSPASRAVPAPLFLSERQLTQRIALMLREFSMSKPRLIATLLTVTGLLTLTGRVAMRALPLQIPPLEFNKNSSQEASQREDEANVATVENQDLKLARRVEPVYPPLAKMARIQGNVVLDVRIEANGEVTDIKMQSGHPLLVRAALEAVAQWRFEPSPILPTTTTVTLQFRLPKDQTRREPDSALRHFPHISMAINGRSASYPEEAKRLHIEGQVALEVTIDQNGQASDFRVLKSDHDLLTRAAEDLLRQLPEPYGRIQPRPGVQKVVVDFSLEDKPRFNEDGPLPAVGRLSEAPSDLLILHHEVAIYPEEARRDGIQGKVAVELMVDEKGDVTDARVLDGPEPLRNAALDAARKWRFAPPSQAPVSATVVMDFVLPDRPLQESTQPETNGQNEQEQVSKHDLVQGKLELAAAETRDAKPASETKPVPIYKPEPPYPQEAHSAKIREATVLCWIDIDTEGKVSDVRVEKLAGHGFDEITEKTLRTWKFKPALRKGVPVPTRAKVEISFRLF